MTICASVKVRDGLVLATDSMSQIFAKDVTTQQIGVVKTYSNARKLFQAAGLPMGIMSYGIGNIGRRSVQGLLREFVPSSNTVKDVADALFTFIKSPYDSEFGTGQKPGLGFFVAGYSEGKPFAEEWEFLLPRDNATKLVRAEDTFGASWRGIDLPFTRLYKGFDPRIGSKLKSAGLDDKQIKEVFHGLELPVVFDGMPVQDAIDFAVFICKTTIGMSTFEAGPPGCGGPLQVATILPDSGFEWISKPSLIVNDLR